MQKVMIKVGFWSDNGSYNDQYPDVKDHVDASWSPLIKEAVLMHLKAGKTTNHWKGWSDCRICGKMNGSTDQSDGTYEWPEGFAHYIVEHNVKPTKEFIDHVIACASAKK